MHNNIMHALIIVHIVYCNNKKTPYSFKQGGMLPNNTKALSKHIVSFGAAKCKRNTVSKLAVIFIPIFKEMILWQLSTLVKRTDDFK